MAGMCVSINYECAGNREMEPICKILGTLPLSQTPSTGVCVMLQLRQLQQHQLAGGAALEPHFVLWGVPLNVMAHVNMQQTQMCR